MLTSDQFMSAKSTSKTHGVCSADHRVSADHRAEDGHEIVQTFVKALSVCWHVVKLHTSAGGALLFCQDSQGLLMCGDNEALVIPP